MVLIDSDPHVIEVWRYLISARDHEIKKLPMLDNEQTVDDLKICQEARWLIGFWVGIASAYPKKTQTKWGTWSETRRELIAQQVSRIRDWKAILADYRDAPDIEATWFIDPPYTISGRHYRHNSINYQDVAEFVRDRRGLTLVCEQAGARWLPFKTLGTVQTGNGPGRIGFSNEKLFVQRKVA